MKLIVKGGEPRGLRDWRLANKRTPQNLSYQNIPRAVLESTRAALLEEQGYICGYTMMRIADSTQGHIEHIAAQSRKKELQVAYSNMIYCHPGDGDPHCPFGAHGKGDIVVSAGNFVSPLDPTCESRFVYRDNGAIGEARDGDAAAESAITILRLNHAALTKARAAAILRLPIFHSRAPAVTASRAGKLVDDLLAKDRVGRFPEYAIALSQVMSRYAKRRAAKEAAIGAR